MGAVLSLTGANATVGEDVRRAVALAVEHVNAEGGVLGKKFNVIVEDSGGNPTTALNAARKLVSVDKVPVVIGEYSSGISIPLGQYLVKEGITHINIASTSVKIRDLGATSFNLIGLEDKGNKFSAKDAWDQGYRSVAMIAPNNAYGQGVAHGFAKNSRNSAARSRRRCCIRPASRPIGVNCNRCRAATRMPTSIPPTDRSRR